MENTEAFLCSQFLSPGYGEGSDNLPRRPEVPPVMAPHQWNSGPSFSFFFYPARFAFRSSSDISAHPPLYYTTRYSDSPFMLDNE